MVSPDKLLVTLTLVRSSHIAHCKNLLVELLTLWSRWVDTWVPATTLTWIPLNLVLCDQHLSILPSEELTTALTLSDADSLNSSITSSIPLLDVESLRNQLITVSLTSDLVYTWSLDLVLPLNPWELTVPHWRS